MIRIQNSSLLSYSSNQIRKLTSGDKPTCNMDTTYRWEREQQFKTTETITKKEQTTWEWSVPSDRTLSKKIQNFGSWISQKIPSIDNQGPTEFQRGRALGYEEGFRDGIWKGMSMTALYGSAMVGISTIFGRLYPNQ